MYRIPLLSNNALCINASSVIRSMIISNSMKWPITQFHTWIRITVLGRIVLCIGIYFRSNNKLTIDFNAIRSWCSPLCWIPITSPPSNQGRKKKGEKVGVLSGIWTQYLNVNTPFTAANRSEKRHTWENHRAVSYSTYRMRDVLVLSA